MNTDLHQVIFGLPVTCSTTDSATLWETSPREALPRRFEGLLY
jgi:hypothetical protein